MFAPEHPISALRPADYNPRRISEESLANLKHSLLTLGIVKPVVALQDGLIVAGHQRTKAATAAGITHTPVCFLSKKPNPQDEIRFNQLHNGTDLDTGEEQCWVEPCSVEGFAEAKLLKANHRAPGASVRSEMARMLTAYGNWGGCVASFSGEVLSSASYAMAAHVIGFPVRTFYVGPEKEQMVRDIFAQAFGQYDYSKIERRTYNQTFAQMFRLRGGARSNASPTYEWLLQEVPKTARILDFGCGQGDYVKALSKQGYQIHGVEFFRRDGNALDLAAAHKMIDKLVLSLKAFGQFDVVICDYVLNSVDSQQAEDDVMACCNAFLKMGGTMFFSGRPTERIEKGAKMSRRVGAQREIEFLDENNMSALYRGGDWFFQKFHSKEQIAGIVQTFFDDACDYQRRDKTSAWQVKTVKTKLAPGIEDAVRREFDLPLPHGSFDRHDDVMAALERLI